MLLRFPRDLHLRKRFFVLESFNHKARTNLYWLAWLVDHYTGEGSTILDPMGGAGSILFAAVKDRPVLTGDIEAHWCRLQGENARRLTTQTLFCTSMRICQWDAARLPLPNAIIPAIVTSPPYFDLFSNWNRTAGTEFDGPYMGETGNCYGFSQRQIGNFHIYEDYLKAMHQVYSEFWRILGQGGILVLIIGDKVHKGTIVPVTVDTMTLCRAIGFDVIARHERATIPSHFRRIHAQRDADYPLIDRETALVLQKQEARQLTKIAIVEIPTPDSLPGRQLFHKMLTYAECIADADH